MQKKKSCNAYFTVEAALVLPLVISAILLGIYLFCFQYDRCLMEQDTASLMLWCSEARSESKGTIDELEESIHTRTGEISRDKYVAWELTAMEVRLEKNHITVAGGGQLIFPVPGWNFWNDDNIWQAETVYEYESLSPVFYIRQIRKLAGLLEKENDVGGK